MRFIKLIFVVALTVVSISAKGQTAVGPAATDSLPSILQSIAAGGSIVVEMPESLARLMQNNPPAEESENAETEVSEFDEQRAETQRPASRNKVAGYRVQVYADNNARQAKAEARMRERAVGRVLPYATYVIYSSPYWRLRVGDFRTQEEANKAAALIREKFPKYAREVRVVRDHVYAR